MYIYKSPHSSNITALYSLFRIDLSKAYVRSKVRIINLNKLLILTQQVT